MESAGTAFGVPRSRIRRHTGDVGPWGRPNGSYLSCIPNVPLSMVGSHTIQDVLFAINRKTYEKCPLFPPLQTSAGEIHRCNGATLAGSTFPPFPLISYIIFVMLFGKYMGSSESLKIDITHNGKFCSRTCVMTQLQPKVICTNLGYWTRERWRSWWEIGNMYRLGLRR